jgi:hypothetical protein
MGAETWTENILRKFERHIIRKIYGPVMENNIWRIRHNEEINTLPKGEDVVRFKNKIVGACRKNGRESNAKENVKRKAIFQLNKRKT